MATPRQHPATGCINHVSMNMANFNGRGDPKALAELRHHAAGESSIDRSVGSLLHYIRMGMRIAAARREGRRSCTSPIPTACWCSFRT